MPDRGRKNICMFLLNSYVNDGRVRRTCRFLSSNGYKVSVIAESSSDRDDEIYADGVRIIRLNSSGLPTSKGRFIKYMFRAAKRGSSVNADIYHAFDLDTLLPAVIASTINRGTVIYEAHEYYVGLEALLGRPLIRAVWSFLERILIHKADRVITINGSIAQRLSGRYAIPVPEIVYSFSDMQNTGKLDYLRERFEIPQDIPVVLYLGVLRRGQGLEMLLNVMAKVESAVLVMVGDGPLKDQLRNKSTELGLNNKIYFCDFDEKEDISLYYRSADIGVLLMEPLAENNRLALPNKFFSYLAAGLPVIVSDVPELHSFVNTYNLGVAVPFEIEDAVEAFNKLLTDNLFYDQCRENALEFSREYTWEKQVQKYISIYDELING